MKLIVGLGNPGSEYVATRHNIGFSVAMSLAERNRIALKRKGYSGFFGVGRVTDTEATILLPQTFMNRSGASVSSACKSLGIKPGDLVVVHDDIDLDYGCLRIKVGGGHGGHNGIGSIAEVMGQSDFIRLRVGIGRPEGGIDVSRYVLGVFSPSERKVLPDFVEYACVACEVLLTQGVDEAMNQFNNKNFLNR